MPKFIIRYGLGDLDSAEVIEANSLDAAGEIAENAAREEAESSMAWDAEVYTPEAAARYGLDDEETSNG